MNDNLKITNKRNWKKLWEHKCPVIGCKTRGVKTNLISNGNILTCLKCKGRWSLEIPTPMDITWIEIKSPQEK